MAVKTLIEAPLIKALGVAHRKTGQGRIDFHPALGEPGGFMAFRDRRLLGVQPPERVDCDGLDSDEVQVRLDAVVSVCTAALATGARPAFSPGLTTQISSPWDDLSPLQVALRTSDGITNLEWLERSFLHGPDQWLTAPDRKVRFPAAVETVGGFLLERADGSLTLRQVIGAAPEDRLATLRVLYILHAFGIVTFSATGARTEKAEQGSREEEGLGDLESFLDRTATSGISSGSVRTTGSSPPRRVRDIVELTPPPKDHTTDEDAEREELNRRCSDVKGQDYYSVLGVDPKGSDADIRQAYYRLARKYHPDRMHKSHLEDLRDRVERMFAAITEAYNTLSHPTSRAEYDRHRIGQASGARPSTAKQRKITAKELFLRARKMMDSKKLFEAISLFEAAIKQDAEKAEYYHYLGVCQGQNPRWRKKAVENLQRSLTLSPGNTETYLALARVFHRGGLESRARAAYEKVLEWDPDNQEAQEFFAGPKGSKGLLGSLFNKRS